jgi:hypothetical protein
MQFASGERPSPGVNMKLRWPKKRRSMLTLPIVEARL